MKAAQTIELTNLIQEITKDRLKAERIVQLVEEAVNTQDLKEIFLTKNDKVEIFSRLDSHFKWLVGIMIALFSIAIALTKLH